MAKKQILPKRIKTSRYWTKSCNNCGLEYPNWFTSCPKCKTQWVKPTSAAAEVITQLPARKTIKIVVKITDESIDNPIVEVNLIFTADGGHSWFKVPMEKKQDYYISEVEEMPLGSDVIYYIEAQDTTGDIIVENNDGEYFYYHVGPQTPEEQAALERQVQLLENPSASQSKPFLLEKREKTPAPSEANTPNYTIKKPIAPTQSMHPMDTGPKPATKSTKHGAQSGLLEELKQKMPRTPQPYEGKPDRPATINSADDLTIFGKPQTQVEDDLKICSNCQSKIKSLWTSCPICGQKGV